MKRRCLPSPEASDEECVTAGKIKRIKLQSSNVHHEFADILGGESFEVVGSHDGVARRTQLNITAGKVLFVVFFGVLNKYLDSVNEAAGELAGQVQVLGVSSHIETNRWSFPVIVNGARICSRLGVLDPLGGGVYPRDVLVAYDVNGTRQVALELGAGGRTAGAPLRQTMYKILQELEMFS